MSAVNDVPVIQEGVQRFTAYESDRAWWAIASSDDGVHLAAAVAQGAIYTSNDGGLTWTERPSGSRYWRGMTSSSDGMKLASTAIHDGIYISGDGGATWTRGFAGNRIFKNIASSSDGSRLIAVATGSKISISTDGGSSWSDKDSARIWSDVASSSDGMHLVAVTGGVTGTIFTSTDGGDTWTLGTGRPVGDFITAASSGDGMRLVACVYGGQIYTSDDGGATWTARESNRFWTDLASSEDGERLTAIVTGGQIYLSNDFGVTWTPRDNDRYWRSVAMSREGTRHVAVASGASVLAPGDQIYVSVSKHIAVSMSVDGTPTPFSLDLTATDADLGDTLTWSIAEAASHGFATASGTGGSLSVGYVPNGGYSGDDTFTVAVSDGTDVDTIIVDVSITGVASSGGGESGDRSLVNRISKGQWDNGNNCGGGSGSVLGLGLLALSLLFTARRR